MEKQILKTWGGEFYSAPTLDILTVEVEQGFAQTNGILDYTEPGGSGFTGREDNDLGTL